MQRRTRLTILLLLAGLVAACSGGGDGVPMASLTGEVKRMNGEPVGDVTVVFYPKEGPSAIARTDDAGQFTATVPVGECRVAVIAEASASSEDTSPEALEALAEAKSKSKVKPKFATPETSGLSVTVEPTQDEKVVFVVE